MTVNPRLMAFFILALALCPLPLGAAPGPAATTTATFVVDWYGDGPNFHDINPGDGICQDIFGGCALRTALEEANSHPGADVITFNAAMNITVNSSSGALPALATPVTIDASSVWDTVNNQPGVTLSGNGMDIYGLNIIADSCAVYGLYITNCGEGAIHMDSAYNTIGGPGAGQRNVLSGNGASGTGVGVYIVGSSAQHNVVQNNYIGLSPAGNVKEPNVYGVRLVNRASNNTIGGATAGTGNVISGNNNNGVEIGGPDTDGNQLGGNIIGLAAGGIMPLGNGNRGVAVNQSTGTQIGSASLLPNLIAYNASVGLDLGDVTTTTVQGNVIHGNQGDGIYLEGADSTVLFNTIAYNTGNGVRVSGSTSLRNQIVTNSIHHNGGKGIELINGANAMLASPTITSANAGSVAGTVTGGGRVVYVYSDTSDEGDTYHGSCIVNTITGQWTYNGAIAGPNATALATDITGNTSRFSAPVAVSGASSGTCASPLPIACGQQVTGDTFGQANNHTGYSCGWDATGPELIYQFTLAPGRDYTVIAELGNMMVDLDVYLLAAGGCNAGQCLSAGSYGDYKVVASNVPPGTYYIAVDGYSGAAGSYTLKLDCGAYSLYLPLIVKNY